MIALTLMTTTTTTMMMMMTVMVMISGVYQCGPCPVVAVKHGEINVGFDTSFVFSEVDAEVVHWVVDPDGEIITHSSIKKDESVVASFT